MFRRAAFASLEQGSSADRPGLELLPRTEGRRRLRVTLVRSHFPKETWMAKGKEKEEQAEENLDLLFDGLEEICDEELFSEVCFTCPLWYSRGTKNLTFIAVYR
jgi:hypothetical protein